MNKVNTEKATTLPTWQDCAQAVKQGVATPLQVFIYNHEPGSPESSDETVEFRAELAAVLGCVGGDTAVDDTDLLPCPFCGAKLLTPDDDAVPPDYYSINHSPDCFLFEGIEYTRVPDVRSWNSRADIVPQVLTCGKCSNNHADAVAYLKSIGADTDEERILLAEFLATAPTVRQIWLATSIALAQRKPDIAAQPDGEDVDLAHLQECHATKTAHTVECAIDMKRRGEWKEVNQ